MKYGSHLIYERHYFDNAMALNRRQAVNQRWHHTIAGVCDPSLWSIETIIDDNNLCTIENNAIIPEGYFVLVDVTPRQRRLSPEYTLNDCAIGFWILEWPMELITMTSHERHVVSNHQSFVCLTAYAGLHQETPKSALLALCEGNSPMTGEFPTQRASNAEKASIDVIMMHSI